MFVQNHDEKTLILLLCVRNQIHHSFLYQTHYVDNVSLPESQWKLKPHWVLHAYIPVTGTLTVLPFLPHMSSPKNLDCVAFFRLLSFYQISSDNAGEPVEIEGCGEVQGRTDPLNEE